MAVSALKEAVRDLVKAPSIGEDLLNAKFRASFHHYTIVIEIYCFKTMHMELLIMMPSTVQNALAHFCVKIFSEASTNAVIYCINC